MASTIMLFTLLLATTLPPTRALPWLKKHVDIDAHARAEEESLFQLEPSPFEDVFADIEGFLDEEEDLYGEDVDEESSRRNLKAQSGETFYRVKKLNSEDSPVYPAEVFIEIVHPKPPKDTWYSVTIVSGNRYTGTANLLGNAPRARDLGKKQSKLVYSWKPAFPGKYEVIVHELPTNPMGLDPTPRMTRDNKPTMIRVKSRPEVLIGPWGAMENRMRDLPPCSTVDRMDLYTHFDGSWIGPDMHTREGRLRTGWMFLPSEEMNCKIETFAPNDFRYLPEEKSIYILGNSKERGIFLSLVDLLLAPDEKRDIEESVISKCWGRALVQKSNLKVMYQDWRSDNFDTRTNAHSVVCHNEKVAREGGPLFFDSGLKVWDEIFHDETQWPSVILMSTGNDMWGFGAKQYDINEFIKRLPPHWTGTLFLTDGAFSARLGGRGYANEVAGYRNRLKELTQITNDSRVRWLDGIGLSKEMRMYGEDGPEHTSISQHFHGSCDIKYHDAQMNIQEMRVCSNVTENIAQILIGHAVGPKKDLIDSKMALPRHGINAPQFTTYCHACPKDLLPFHITPYPDMTCNVGRLHPTTRGEMKSNFQTCPKECLDLEVTRTKGSQTDLIYERNCPIDFFPMGFTVGNEGSGAAAEVQRSLAEEYEPSTFIMDVWFYSSSILVIMLAHRHRYRIRSMFR